MISPLIPGQISGSGALTVTGVVTLTNQERMIYLGAGHALVENKLLDLAAANKVKDMFSGQYFEHLSPGGRDATYFVGGAGYEYISIGENLAMGDYEDDADLLKAWMESPSHRENILKPGYKEIGVAVGYGTFQGRKTWLAVQEFGIPKSACPAIDQNLSLTIDNDKQTIEQYSQQQDALLVKINEEKALAAELQKELNELLSSNGSVADIKAKYAQLNEVVDAANTDVDIYNGTVDEIKSIYGGYKSLIDEYNQQVNAYNSCAAALE
jgi:hypothetical protein